MQILEGSNNRIINDWLSSGTDPTQITKATHIIKSFISILKNKLNIFLENPESAYG